jgi:hypothetical protein
VRADEHYDVTMDLASNDEILSMYMDIVTVVDVSVFREMCA